MYNHDCSRPIAPYISFIREREYSHAGLVIFDMGDCCSPIRQSGIVKLVELNCVLTGVLSLTDDA